ncbi:MAG: hypothetical protein JNK82_13780 [Myxococcaceae bacterium]|nr:hypothetical protein [Myxococcaceae bacterium]
MAPLCRGIGSELGERELRLATGLNGTLSVTAQGPTGRRVNGGKIPTLVDGYVPEGVTVTAGGSSVWAIGPSDAGEYSFDLRQVGEGTDTVTFTATNAPTLAVEMSASPVVGFVLTPDKNSYPDVTLPLSLKAGQTTELDLWAVDAQGNKVCVETQAGSVFGSGDLVVARGGVVGSDLSITAGEPGSQALIISFRGINTELPVTVYRF